MRRRQAPAGALPAELMVLVVEIEVLRLAALCTLKTEQRGGQGRLEPAVLANL